MEQLTKKITRSYTRKLNTGNYTSEDFMSSYSEEILAETSKEEMQRISTFLYDLAKSDVEEAVKARQLELNRNILKDKPLSTYEYSSEVFE